MTAAADRSADFDDEDTLAALGATFPAWRIAVAKALDHQE